MHSWTTPTCPATTFRRICAAASSKSSTPENACSWARRARCRLPPRANRADRLGSDRLQASYLAVAICASVRSVPLVTRGIGATLQGYRELRPHHARLRLSSYCSASSSHSRLAVRAARETARETLCTRFDRPSCDHLVARGNAWRADGRVGLGHEADWSFTVANIRTAQGTFGSNSRQRAIPSLRSTNRSASKASPMFASWKNESGARSFRRRTA